LEGAGLGRVQSSLELLGFLLLLSDLLLLLRTNLLLYVLVED